MKWMTSLRLRGRRPGQGLSARHSALPTRRPPRARTSPHWTRSRGPAGPVRLPPAQCSRLRFNVAKGEGPRLKRMAVSMWRGVPLQWRVSVRLGVVCYACTVCPFLSLNDPGPVYRHTLLTHPGRPHAFHCSRCGHSHNKLEKMQRHTKKAHPEQETDITMLVYRALHATSLLADSHLPLVKQESP